MESVPVLASVPLLPSARRVVRNMHKAKHGRPMAGKALADANKVTAARNVNIIFSTHEGAKAEYADMAHTDKVTRIKARYAALSPGERAQFMAHAAAVLEAFIDKFPYYAPGALEKAAIDGPGVDGDLFPPVLAAAITRGTGRTRKTRAAIRRPKRAKPAAELFARHLYPELASLNVTTPEYRSKLAEGKERFESLPAMDREPFEAEHARLAAIELVQLEAFFRLHPGQRTTADPFKPKRPPRPDHLATVDYAKEHAMSYKEARKVAWTNTSDEDKAKYIARAKEEEKAYAAKLATYKVRFPHNAYIHADAIPAGIALPRSARSIYFDNNRERAARAVLADTEPGAPLDLVAVFDRLNADWESLHSSERADHETRAAAERADYDALVKKELSKKDAARAQKRAKAKAAKAAQQSASSKASAEIAPRSAHSRAAKTAAAEAVAADAKASAEAADATDDDDDNDDDDDDDSESSA
ncbi:uncharacterized protein AMSG_03006 [Thecamonas trahens ATCC 50062]|uniref:HMG box domain-containing protein n=1 Tax=Thecamonas trahens ATCC 50062 TaxID=461836 RepID=A0A0L0D326_THETB|nr:hypothetical protein AMSG_03006 [Thecamonas trahens ATCC 50062]KNC46571.1 hypothetical protein AMSG_03006 [Thecamonas trahens ATCC 50062]|eukprot:XP_013760348.1 hypothetical protein AMSG_03006 [Thecamonas trahens ATCC 50062]